MKYKALICDVDGTTVPMSRDALPSRKVIQAIKKAQKEVHVLLATGRPLFELHNIIKATGISDPCVVCGGAQIVNPRTGEVLWEKTISRESFMEIVKIRKEIGITQQMFFDNGEEDFFDERTSEKILQVGIQAATRSEADRFVTAVSHLSEIAVHTTHSWISNRWDVLITHVEATKLHGIFEVAKRLGIQTHEIIGIGDGGNDFPLLMACGLKVAMGNAMDDLKAIADYVAPSVEEDGLADVINRFILSSSKRSVLCT